MDFELFYEKIFNAMLKGNVQTIVDAAYEVLKLPLMVIDTDYNILAATANTQFQDTIWDSIINKKRASEELIWSFYENKYIDQVCKSAKPIYIDWGIIGIPNYCGAIRINDVVTGYIAMLCPKDRYKEEYIEALSIAAKALTISFSSNKKLNTQKNPMVEIFFRDLLNGILIYEKQLESWRTDFKYIFKGDYVLAAICAENKDSTGILQYLASKLNNKYPNMLSTILAGTLFLLFSSVHSEEKIMEISDEIKKELSSMDFPYSLSSFFSNILETPNYRFQVEKAIELGKLLKPKQKLHLYDDYFSAAILTYAIKEMDELSYIHPAIYKLKEYDAKNNTTYLETLEVYINLMRDTHLSAEKLHIHRNTMLYRINKISDLTQINLDDESICSKLLLSFMMVKLKKDLGK
ncbi:PucR family transcriptional regulator [Clostridium oryzae]|uniref:Purine catabolism regulatory protein n=1 Tax=Clostridium oryzae TaxID=1450648 RepID=A0A1V4IRN8_9CLOT|nr:helix-turn-helix domain-containing protein [Clostridium oryzae]OPJ62549.1 purine catabolism regulatory protein [Clostridium oryzae]